ncbi:MAG: hypothetical protein J4G05_04915 [Chlorobi bacterium]|nr:hypothetical protein [Chlorobiota bacterium]
MRRFQLTGLFIAFLTIHAQVVLAGGGAWVRTESGYYFKIGFTSLTAEEEYGFGGEDRPLFRDTNRFANGRIGFSNLTLYSEYGITDWLTSVISTQYTVAVREADIIKRGMEGLVESESASGLSDTWLSARVRLLPNDSKVAGAATLGWKIPTGSPNKDIPLGTGVADYEAALGFGTGFPVGPETYGYAQVSGGYRLRNKASNEFNWQVETGIGLLPILGLQLILDGVESTANLEEAELSPKNTLVFDELVGSQSFRRFSGGLLYALSDEMDLSAQFTTTLSGINTLNANAFAVGVAWKK